MIDIHENIAIRKITGNGSDFTVFHPIQPSPGSDIYDTRLVLLNDSDMIESQSGFRRIIFKFNTIENTNAIFCTEPSETFRILHHTYHLCLGQAICNGIVLPTIFLGCQDRTSAVKKYQREQIWSYYPQDCSLKKPVKKTIG
jgi:hypothetical protein